MNAPRRLLALVLLGIAPAPRPTTAAGVTTASVPGGGKPVAARADREGAIHLLFDSPGGPAYARSTDDGATFGPIVKVVGDGPKPAGLEYEGWDLAVGRGGRVHVAVGNNAWKLKLPEDEWGYFYARLDPGATAFTPIANLSRGPAEGFSLAADGSGNVAACWLAGRLFASVSRDDGTRFGPPAEVDPSYDPCDCCTTSATFGTDGRLAILYREQTNNDRDMHLVLRDLASGRTTRTRVGTTPWKVDACPMTYFSVNPAPDGGFATAWPTRGRITAARLNPSGTMLPPGEIATPGRSGMRTGLVALSHPDGSTLVAWKEKQDGQAGWQVFRPDGSPDGPAGSAPGSGPGLAAAIGRGGRFVVFP